MTFGSVFGRTFSPTFQPSSQAAAGGDWWDLNGTITSCVAAYQPKGAASYAASKVNLTGNTDYDAVQDGAGNEPTWDTGTGWTFASASAQRLAAGWSAAMKPVTIIVRTNGVSPTIGGYKSDSSTGGQFVLLSATGDKIRFLKSNIAVIGVSTGTYTPGEDTVFAVTYASNGAFAFYIGGNAAGSGTNDQTFVESTAGLIGCYGLGSSRYNYMNGDMHSLALYNAALTSTQIGDLTTAMAAL